MDGSQKRVAIVSEVTRGTTPSDPALLVLREIRTTGGKVQPRVRSPERASHRSAQSTYGGLITVPKQVDMPLAYDDALHAMLASAFQGAWASNVLKAGSTIAPITLEEKFEGGATDFYRRALGLSIDSFSLSCRNGEPGMISFAGMALSESTSSAILTNATYTDPNPGGPPITPGSFVLNDIVGVSAPKVQGLTLNVRNNSYYLHGFGDDAPYDTGLGQLDIDGTLELYFRAAAEYTTFFGTGGLDKVIDITMGGVTNNKYRLKLPNVDVSNPDIGDPGPTGPISISLPFFGKYKTSDATAAQITRAVA